MSVKETAGGVVTTLLKVVGAVLLVGLLLLGGVMLWAGFALDLGYLDICDTTLEDTGTDYDYGMDLLVIDLLTTYEEGDGEDYTATDYYLCAFLDGKETVNLCIFEVQDYDHCFETLRSYIMDDTQQIGDCWVSGIYTFQDGEQELYGEELEQKEQWISEYSDALEAYGGELFGYPGTLEVQDTDYVIYIWPSEEEYLSGMQRLYGGFKVLGVVLIAGGLVGLVLLLRPKKAKQTASAPVSGTAPRSGAAYNPATGAWEPKGAAPVPREEARMYDPAWPQDSGRSPWPEQETKTNSKEF